MRTSAAGIFVSPGYIATALTVCVHGIKFAMHVRTGPLALRGFHPITCELIVSLGLQGPALFLSYLVASLSAFLSSFCYAE